MVINIFYMKNLIVFKWNYVHITYLTTYCFIMITLNTCYFTVLALHFMLDNFIILNELSIDLGFL